MWPFSTTLLCYNATRKKVSVMFSTKEHEMQKAIDMAWANPTNEQKLFQERYFTNGKPRVEEFIKTISAIARQKKSS